MKKDKIFYTVDRTGYLKESMILDLQIYKDIEPDYLQTHVDKLFPDGVSSHGNIYFLNGKQDTLHVSPNLELVFEYVRRSNFKDLPSRFQSVFAWDNIEDARWFLKNYPGEKSFLYEVKSDVIHKANMKLLNANSSILVTSYFAEMYWKGEEGSVGEIRWEYLLKCPVQVLKRVKL